MQTKELLNPYGDNEIVDQALRGRIDGIAKLHAAGWISDDTHSRFCPSRHDEA